MGVNVNGPEINAMIDRLKEVSQDNTSGCLLTERSMRIILSLSYEYFWDISGMADKHTGRPTGGHPEYLVKASDIEYAFLEEAMP